MVGFLLAHLAAGGVTLALGGRRLTGLGAWGLPRALARAWGRDLDIT